MRQTTAVLLDRRPVGTAVAEALTLGTIDLPELTPGTALVRNQYMSVDPSTRGRMDPGEKQYTTNFEIGGPLDGSAIGIVDRVRVGEAAGRRDRAASSGLARVRRRRRCGGHHLRPREGAGRSRG